MAIKCFLESTSMTPKISKISCLLIGLAVGIVISQSAMLLHPTEAQALEKYEQCVLTKLEKGSEAEIAEDCTDLAVAWCRTKTSDKYLCADLIEKKVDELITRFLSRTAY
jgi:hypothetical protein